MGFFANLAATELRRMRRFRLIYGGRAEWVAGDVTEAEARQLWPSAKIAPMNERVMPSRPATPPERAEIRAHLARLCGSEHGDYPEALACALDDPGAALEAFRAEGVL
jgi:hypothetical protein